MVWVFFEICEQTTQTLTDSKSAAMQLPVRYWNTHTRLTALCPGLPGTRKAKAIWILLKQETVSGSGTSWSICKSAPCSRQVTTRAPHHSVFTGQMPFLLPNQRVSAGTACLIVYSTVECITKTKKHPLTSYMPLCSGFVGYKYVES